VPLAKSFHAALVGHFAFPDPPQEEHVLYFPIVPTNPLPSHFEQGFDSLDVLHTALLIVLKVMLGFDFDANFRYDVKEGRWWMKSGTRSLYIWVSK
jgi:hypothetical protein